MGSKISLGMFIWEMENRKEKKMEELSILSKQ